MCQSLHYSEMVFYEKDGKFSSQINQLDNCVYIYTWAQERAHFIKCATYVCEDLSSGSQSRYHNVYLYSYGRMEDRERIPGAGGQLA